MLDIMMPGESGFDLCRRVRRTSDVPILFLSARGRRRRQDPRAGTGRRRLHRQVGDSGRGRGARESGAAPVHRPGSGRDARLTLGPLEIDLRAREVRSRVSRFADAQVSSISSSSSPNIRARSSPTISCWSASGKESVTVTRSPSQLRVFGTRSSPIRRIRP